jgi:crotonobetainyl-CoA:carnitine CoA-transferase CaiB-like acyl-CoA transferase
MLVAGNDGQFGRLCEAIGMPQLAKDERFARNDARVQHRSALMSILKRELAKQPVAYWTDRLALAGVPAGPINDIAAVFADPQVQHRGMRIEVQHPLAGALPLVGNPLRLSDTGVRYGMPPPLLGQHTDVVLTGLLQLSTAELNELRRSGVV